MRTTVRRVWAVIAEGTAHFFKNHGFVYSAAIAFNILLSAIPVLFLVFAATSLFIGRDELPFSILSEFLKDTFPYGAQVLVPNLKELFESGATFGIVGTLLLLASSFSVTDAVNTSLAVMLGVPRKKWFFRSVRFHVFVVLAMTLLASAAIFVPPLWEGLSFLTRGMSAKVDVAYHLLLDGVAELVLVLLVFGASLLSYRHLSPRRVTLDNALIGSLAFLLLLEGIKFGFVFYVKKFSRLNVIYGSLFSLICFIIVTYLFAAAYLFCASIIGILEKGENGDDAASGD
jgi:YihY family inner membrane protein